MSADHQPQSNIMLRIPNIVFADKTTGELDWLFDKSHRIKKFNPTNGICMNMSRQNHDKMSSSSEDEVTPVFTAMGIKKTPAVGKEPYYYQLKEGSIDFAIIAESKTEAIYKCKTAITNNLEKVHNEVLTVFSGNPQTSTAISKVKSGNKAAWPEIF
jgi:hypothetical protein